ncbi:MAG: ATP synthase subunit I [Candidatus Aminicenantes bacterium]|nr:ATP synthase subunit I [Candidatus Aminicenantes bacterium]
MTDPEKDNLAGEEERILKRIPQEIVLLSLVLAVGTWIVFDGVSAALVFAGGILAAINFIWMRQAISRFLSSGKKKALRSGIAVYSIRLLLILGIFFIIILFFSEKILAFAAGFSTLIVVFLLEAVVGLSKLKEWKN